MSDDIQLISYPIILSCGVTARLYLPYELTDNDVSRLNKMIISLQANKTISKKEQSNE